MATYFPAFTIRESEIKGYAKLAGPTKDNIFPIVSLQAWPRKKNGFPSQVERSILKLDEACEARPLALDLAKARTDLSSVAGLQSRDEIMALHNPQDGFNAWTRFVAKTPHVPVYQWTSEPGAANLQIGRLLDLGRSIVLRFKRSEGWNLSQLGLLPKSALAGQAVLAVIDCEQIGRNHDLTALGTLIQGALLLIHNYLEQSHVTVVLIGSSFPSEFATIHPEYAEMDIRERQLHAMLASSPPLVQAGITLRYGDYAGVFADEKPQSFRGRPRVDLACPTQWIYHRRPVSDGYSHAASLVVGSAHWDEQLMCWGTQEIRRAASGDVVGLGSGTPWTAIRINTHLHQQAHYGEGNSGPIEEEWKD